MRVLRAGDRLVTPWKNGGGSTTEIAVHPAGADFDSFGWRVSIASVATDGPFSVFPEIDRTLAVLSGAGIQLSIDGGVPVRVGIADAPLAFPGDVQTHGVLIDGPIVDLNVMSRRGRVKHHMKRHISDRLFSVEMAGAVNLILARSDELVVSYNGQAHRLEMNDAALISQSGSVVTITPEPGRQSLFFTVALMAEHV